MTFLGKLLALIGLLAIARAWVKHDRFWRQARMW